MKTKLLAVCLCLLLLFTALDPQILAADADGVGGTPDGALDEAAPDGGADEAPDGGADEAAPDGAGMGAAAISSGSSPVLQNNVSITPAPDYMVTIEIYFKKGTTVAPNSEIFAPSTEIRIKILPQFHFPESVTLQIAERADANTVFGDPQSFAPGWDAPAQLSLNETACTFSVTNYDFDLNKKLIIQYKNEPKTGFLGGNAVPFLMAKTPNNQQSSGYFVDGTPRYWLSSLQTVNVPIPEIVVEPLCKNVYAGVPVTAADLKSGAVAYVKDDSEKVNILALDTNSTEKWRKNRVTVMPEIYYPDPADNIKGLPDDGDKKFSFKQDTVYALNVKIEPSVKSNIPTNTPPAAAGGGANAVNIFVYKPVVTFQDLTNVYYGDEANLTAAYVRPPAGQQWRHYNETTTSATTAFIGNNGAAPALDPVKLRFAEADGREILGDYHVNQPLDYHIKVIGGGYADIDGVSLKADDMSFAHRDCPATPPCGFDPDKGQFMLHVETCSLTINKTMPDNPHQSTPGESFVYTVANDNDWAPVTLQVAAHTIRGEDNKIICESVTLKGLPVGTYNVTEDKTWSWRYNARYAPETCTLSSDKLNGFVEITNEIDSTKTKWLSYDYYLENRWGTGGRITKVVKPGQ